MPPTESVIEQSTEQEGREHTFTSVLDELNIVTNGVIPTVREEVQVEEKQPEQKEEKPVDTKTETDPKQPVLSPKARDNFAKLEEAKKAAEAERDKLKAEFDSTNTKLKEYEEKLKTAPNAEEFTAKEQKYQQQLAEFDQKLREVALEKHPAFIQQFDQPKQFLQNQLKDLAVSAGATPEDFQRAVKLGMSEKLDEIRELLPTHAQRRWDAALTQMETVELQRQQALENGSSTMEQIQRRQQEEIQAWQAKTLQENISLARKLADEPFEKIEALKDNDDLRQQVRSTLEAIAGGKGSENWGKEQIMREFAASVVQRNLLQTQHQVIEGKDKELAETKAKLEELEKKLTERESFINQRYGSIPRNEVNGSSATEQKSDKASWEDIVIAPR